MFRAFAPALVVAAASAPAAAQPSAPPGLDLTTSAAACKPASSDEVVVCGERGDNDRYRIDPDVLQVMRAEERAANPGRPASRIAEGDPCGVGPNGCPGEGALPLMQMALTAAAMAVKAVQGEDWREPLRTKRDEYQAYRDSKDRREKGSPSGAVAGTR